MKQKQALFSSETGKKMTLLISIIVLAGAAFMLMGVFSDSDTVGKAILKPECSDQIDNDGDGYCDYLTRRTRCKDGSIPGDVDCTTSTDNKEAPDCEPVPERCDGYDNNCNSQIDEGLPIACSASSDCGTYGWTGSTYCGADGNVYRDYISYQCSFPGTCSSACSSQTSAVIYQTCSNGCTNGVCNANDSLPVAAASASPTSGTEPLTVSFLGSATGGDAPLSYNWNFGDSSFASGQNVQHTYLTAGLYNAVLTVTDADGDVASDSVVVTVNEPDLFPSASASASPASGTVPLTVSFTGSASGGNAPLTYLWNFGDGTTSTAQNPQHTYSTNGTFVASFQVTDADGDAASSNVAITASNPPFDFSVSASPTTATVTGGNSGTSTVTVSLVSGATKPVSLSFVGCPTKTSCWFTPVASGNPAYSTTFVAWTTSNANGTGTPAGSYPITIIGTGDGKQRTATYTLAVN